MNDFEGLLTSDYGFKPQGKSAPMAAARSNSTTTRSTPLYTNFIDEGDPIFNPSRTGKAQGMGSVDGFPDVFDAPPKYSSTPDNRHRGGEFDFDSVFGGHPAGTKASGPVFDKPVYDDEGDVFAGVPGMRPPNSANFENVFASMASPENGTSSSPFEDLLGGIGGNPGGSAGNSFKKDDADSVKRGAADFDDLLPGFGGGSPASARHTSGSTTKRSSHAKEDPFSGVDSPLTHEGPDSGVFVDPLEEIGNLSKNGNKMVDESPVGVFDDFQPLDMHEKERSSLRNGSSSSGRQVFHGEKSPEKLSADSPGSSRKKATPNNTSDSYQSIFGMPSDTNNSHFFGGQSGSPPPYEESVPSDINSPSAATLHSTEPPDDIWLTVSEIPLFTQPTSAPPPSRPPPPRPARVRKAETGARSPRTNVTDFPSFYNSTQNSQTPKSGTAGWSSVDELEDFAKGKAYAHSNAHNDVFDEDLQAQSDAAASAAAMKEAMNRAEAKFRHAKELKERENAKAYRNRENNTSRDDVEILEREQNQREEEEREKQRLEKERMKARELEKEREREEKDREQRRLEREKERAREEREKARQAVERATREARERAATDARLRAEKAAVDKANFEARERAERLAVQRAQAEARERAAAEAKERAEKAAAEARARSNAEAKERAAKAENEARIRTERAAVERAAKEARERAAAQARERAAASRANQQKPEDDLESFFSSGSRPSSAPRASANNSDSLFNSQFQTKQGTESARKTSSGSSSIRKASSATNIVDDLSSIFGGSPQSGSFQEVEGETEERRRARIERHQRTNERAAKALAEKNERDLQTQREQAERHRLSETLDAEIKRWAAGKEGNLRALLSTLQYILWPECGWLPVSLTDLITGAAVKKVYRKATLCIHPDKVQQKGANLQQKYIAEKVFDLLKEAWNKFNSEELF
uniref:Uncharacterized protein n=1 Tax=Kalanchoe fedtschenkoi TaxID=63787 RepID=A0A7N0TVM5_KALFE